MVVKGRIQCKPASLNHRRNNNLGKDLRGSGNVSGSVLSKVLYVTPRTSLSETDPKCHQ